MSDRLSRRLNGLGALALSLVLIAAFVDQLAFGELPCPLCILQRAGFCGAALGLALNAKFGPRPSHYGVVILSALAGGAVAARQTLLHIVPGSGSFGDAMLGMHLYTWALAINLLVVAGAATMLLFDRQFAESATGSRLTTFAAAVVTLEFLLALGNGVSTVLECGGGLCPDNPTRYELLATFALR